LKHNLSNDILTLFTIFSLYETKISQILKHIVFFIYVNCLLLSIYLLQLHI